MNKDISEEDLETIRLFASSLKGPHREYAIESLSIPDKAENLPQMFGLHSKYPGNVVQRVSDEIAELCENLNVRYDALQSILLECVKQQDNK